VTVAAPLVIWRYAVALLAWWTGLDLRANKPTCTLCKPGSLRRRTQMRMWATQRVVQRVVQALRHAQRQQRPTSCHRSNDAQPLRAAVLDGICWRDARSTHGECRSLCCSSQLRCPVYHPALAIVVAIVALAQLCQCSCWHVAAVHLY